MAPKIENAPGLQWRKRANGKLVATWVARADLVKRGYTLKTQRVWAGFESDLDAETQEGIAARSLIGSACTRLQDEMLGWAREGTLTQPIFDGSLKALIDIYRRDPDSPYQKIRFQSRRSYDAYMNVIEKEVGLRNLSAIKGKDFLRWYDSWADGGHPYIAHARITMLRMLLSFGIVCELYPPSKIDHCKRLKAILTELSFAQGRPRKEAMTFEQAAEVCKRAHEIRRPSIALAQAFQFELMLRQKDVIGEWVPFSEPGMSSITRHGKKWLYGLDWSEVSDDLILTHKMSKSRTGKELEFDLNNYPMIVQEIALIPLEQRVGPIVKQEETALPWTSANGFRKEWRRAADLAGIPQSVQNRDSRAGGITEANEASGDNLDAARHHAGHASVTTTQRYSRGGIRRRSNLAVLRVAARAKNGSQTT